MTNLEFPPQILQSLVAAIQLFCTPSCLPDMGEFQITFAGKAESCGLFLILLAEVYLLKYAKYLVQQFEYMELQATMVGYLNTAETPKTHSEGFHPNHQSELWKTRHKKIYYRLQQLQTPENYQFYFNSVLWAAALFHS